jgi:hypothetical protein
MAFLVPKACSVRRLAVSVILLIFIGIAGGIVLWQFLPENQKQTLSDIYDNGSVPFSPNVDQNKHAPPPSYQFIQCDSVSSVSNSSVSSNNSSSTDCCNGLVGLCDFPLSSILMAGIHNAQASTEDGFFLAPNHQYDLVSSLDYGYRAINVDLGVCGGELHLVHGLCKLGTVDPARAFGGINRWLDAHPTEVVIIPIQVNNDAGGGEVDLNRFYNLLSTIPGFTGRMYAHKSGLGPWPTLGELVKLDKRIVMFHYGMDFLCYITQNCPLGFHDWFVYASETPFEFNTAADFSDTTHSCNITRGRRTDPDFYALNVFPTVPSLKLSSETLNTYDFVDEHVNACSTVQHGLDVNVVFVDFWNTGDLPSVAQDHNLALIAQGPPPLQRQRQQRQQQQQQQQRGNLQFPQQN